MPLRALSSCLAPALAGDTAPPSQAVSVIPRRTWQLTSPTASTSGMCCRVGHSGRCRACPELDAHLLCSFFAYGLHTLLSYSQLAALSHMCCSLPYNFIVRCLTGAPLLTAQATISVIGCPGSQLVCRRFCPTKAPGPHVCLRRWHSATVRIRPQGARHTLPGAAAAAAWRPHRPQPAAA